MVNKIEIFYSFVYILDMSGIFSYSKIVTAISFHLLLAVEPLLLTNLWLFLIRITINYHKLRSTFLSFHLLYSVY